MTKEQMISAYDRHFETVWRVCFTELGGNREDTEDCVSETFLRYCKSFNGQADNEAHIKGWLIVTAQNVCRSLLRRAYRKDKRLEESPAVISEEDECKELFEAIAMLPENERSAIDLYYFFGYSGEEIAGLLDAKRATVYSWLDRGRKHLEEFLKQGGGR